MCVLDKCICSNAKECQLVSTKYLSSNSKVKNGNDDVIKIKMAKNIGKVGKA